MRSGIEREGTEALMVVGEDGVEVEGEVDGTDRVGGMVDGVGEVVGGGIMDRRGIGIAHPRGEGIRRLDGGARHRQGALHHPVSDLEPRLEDEDAHLHTLDLVPDPALPSVVDHHHHLAARLVQGRARGLPHPHGEEIEAHPLVRGHVLQVALDRDQGPHHDPLEGGRIQWGGDHHSLHHVEEGTADLSPEPLHLLADPTSKIARTEAAEVLLHDLQLAAEVGADLGLERRLLDAVG